MNLQLKVNSLNVGALNSNCIFELGTTPAPLARAVSGVTPNCATLSKKDPTALCANIAALFDATTPCAPLAALSRLSPKFPTLVLTISTIC